MQPNQAVFRRKKTHTYYAYLGRCIFNYKLYIFEFRSLRVMVAVNWLRVLDIISSSRHTELLVQVAIIGTSTRLLKQDVLLMVLTRG